MDNLFWPLAVVFIAFGFMLIFRTQIAGFLGRVREVGSSGIKASSQEAQPPVETKTSVAEELLRTADNLLITEREEAIRKDLQARGLTDPAELARFLTRHLAFAQLALAFENIDNMIWGSQIDLLRAVNAAAAGFTQAELRPYYNGAATRFPEAYQNYAFEGYLGFLLGSQLLLQQGDRFLITFFGREFLVFLTQTGRTAWRPF